MSSLYTVDASYMLVKGVKIVTGASALKSMMATMNSFQI
jgi:hypothetical protein